MDGSVIDKFWTPDTFITNTKEEILHHTPKQNTLFRVSSNGDVMYSIRMTLIASCHMNLKYFPFDVQKCGIEIMSYAYTTRDIQLNWFDEDTNSIQVDDTVTLPQYILVGWHSGDSIIAYMTGNYSALTAHFLLERQIGFYLLQAYIPSSALVTISWLTLWIDPSASPARATLAITTALALITQSTWLRSEIPKVAYVTAIDIWLSTCLLVVFLILLEYALVYFLHKTASERHISAPSTDKCICKESNGSTPHSELQLQPDSNAPSTVSLDGSRLSVSCVSSRGDVVNHIRTNRFDDVDFKKVSQRVDKVCRVVFLLAFIIFAIGYWIVYPLTIVQ
uniref:Glycine receptor subunit alpha-4-like n=1 Tax=Saccoglossus kowalevskii TaxID=10224 RepID=A0ABM0MZQ0_SACKO|nr:PREDICTED: glycine receptor subunit alpha-4-like [Saccoglossus kowalevskii]